MSALYPATLLALSVLHLLTVLSARSFPAPLIAPVAAYLIARILIYIFRPRRPSLPALLREMAVVVVLQAIISDFILNTVSYEPDARVGHSFRLLQLAFLWGLPAVTLVLHSPRWRILFPALGLWFLLVPPWSITLLQTIIVPEYGLTAAMLLLMTIPRWRRPSLLSRDRTVLWLAGVVAALPLAAIPALLNGISVASSVDHIIKLILFAVSAWGFAGLLRRSVQLGRFAAAVSFVSVPSLACLVFFGADLHAVNANFSAMGTEMVLFLSLLAAVIHRRRWVRVSMVFIAIFTLVVQIRILSTTGLLASAVGLGFWVYLRWVHPRMPGPLRTPMIALGFLVPALSGILYLIFGSHGDSVISRVLMWRTASTAVLSDPFRAVFGFGDFGYFFYFVFRDFRGVLSAQDFYILDHLEPFLVIQHPHSDGMMMLYGGGLLHLALMVALIVLAVGGGIRLLQAGRREGAVMISALFAIVFHGITEPFVSTIVTGFFFWFTLGIVRFRPLQVAFSRTGDPGFKGPGAAQVTLTFAILLIFILASRIGGQALRVPALRFWSSHRELIVHSGQRDVESLPREEQNLLAAQAAEALNSLDRSRILQPAQFDLLRQKGEIEGLLFTLTGDEEHLRASHDDYCDAFAFRQAPIHYAGILRTAEGLRAASAGGEWAVCPRRPELRPRISGYDPGNMLRFVPREYL